LELKLEATRKVESNELLSGGAFEDMSSPSSEMLLLGLNVEILLTLVTRVKKEKNKSK
jgi:hypothetical protein